MPHNRKYQILAESSGRNTWCGRVSWNVKGFRGGVEDLTKRLRKPLRVEYRKRLGWLKKSEVGEMGRWEMGDVLFAIYREKRASERPHWNL